MNVMHLSPTEASDYLRSNYGIKRSKKTLANLRSIGGGPGYRKFSPIEVGYPVEELDSWARELLDRPILRNTAQEGVPE